MYENIMKLFLTISNWQIHSCFKMDHLTIGNELFHSTKHAITTRPPFQFTIRRLIVRSREVSKRRDLHLEQSDRSEIWQHKRFSYHCLSVRGFIGHWRIPLTTKCGDLCFCVFSSTKLLNNQFELPVIWDTMMWRTWNGKARLSICHEEYTRKCVWNRR